MVASRVSFKKCRVPGPAKAGSAFSDVRRAHCSMKGSALGLGSCGLEALLLTHSRPLTPSAGLGHSDTRQVIWEGAIQEYRGE